MEKQIAFHHDQRCARYLLLELVAQKELCAEVRGVVRHVLYMTQLESLTNAIGPRVKN
jgi:hypothetical protein